jgi:hypothetical protein
VLIRLIRDKCVPAQGLTARSRNSPSGMSRGHARGWPP